MLDRAPDCALVGVVDVDSQARLLIQAERPDIVAGERLADVAGRVDAEAVILATPPGGRHEQIADACAAGLAILAEKPLADSLAAAAAHVATAEATGVPLMVGLNFRYLAVTQALKALMQPNRLGTAEFARFTYERWRDGRLPHLNKYPLTMDQPMLWEQSIHHFDLLRYVYDAEPSRIAARTYNPSWSMYAGDANVSALIEFDGGLVVSYHGTWASNWANSSFEWRTECARGIAVQADQFGALSYAHCHQPQQTAVSLPPHDVWIDDATALLRVFVEHLRDGHPLECSGADHLKSLRMVEACIHASTTGQTIIPADLPLAAEPDGRTIEHIRTGTRRLQ